MTDETIVAVYDTAAHAEAAIAGLRGAGVPENAISMHAGAGGVGGAEHGEPAQRRTQRRER